MNSRERIDAVVALEVPDRVPVAPLLDHYAATYTGISYATFMADADKRIEAVLETMRSLGPWDMTFAADTANALLLKRGIPARMRVPGEDLPDDEIHQFVETELLTPEDYDLVLSDGLGALFARVQGELYPELALGPGGLPVKQLRKNRERVEAAGAELAVAAFLPIALQYFSLGRSFDRFYLDLYDRPGKVKAALRAFTEQAIPLALGIARAVGGSRLFMGMDRLSPAMLSPAHIEEFVWPDLQCTVEAITAEGFTPILHCDGRWSRAFEMFRRLPPRSCILELDGFTDMFKAKEALGDRMCLMGDVPATLLAFGTRDEVLQYCRRLIEQVGRGGGLILSSGCSIPANARAENVKALAEAAEEWGRYP